MTFDIAKVNLLLASASDQVNFFYSKVVHTIRVRVLLWSSFSLFWSARPLIQAFCFFASLSVKTPDVEAFRRPKTKRSGPLEKVKSERKRKRKRERERVSERERVRVRK